MKCVNKRKRLGKRKLCSHRGAREAVKAQQIRPREKRPPPLRVFPKKTSTHRLFPSQGLHPAVSWLCCESCNELVLVYIAAIRAKRLWSQYQCCSLFQVYGTKRFWRSHTVLYWTNRWNTLLEKMSILEDSYMIPWSWTSLLAVLKGTLYLSSS